MGGVPFFHSDAVADLTEACIELALLYKCDPFVFLDRPEHEIIELYRLTGERLKHLQED